MENKLEKKYGLPTAICMVVGIVIGSGIFFKTEAVLKVTGGNVLTGVLSLVIMGLVLCCCAYAFSILAQKYEKVNGVLDYAEAACGEKYAYYLGWFMTFIYTPGITSVLAWVSAMYFGGLFGFAPNSGEVLAFAGLFLVADCFLNAMAPKLAGATQVSTTVIKLIPLVLMAVVGTFVGLTNGQLAANFAAPAAAGVSAVGGMTASVVALAFAFEGWILATSINAELKDAKRNLPLALLIGSAVIVVIYVSYYLGICGSISVDELMASGSTEAFKKMFGNVFGTLLNVFITVSCLGTMNGLMMANVRSLYGLAVRGHGPKPEVFASVDPTTKMPIASAMLGCLTAMVWMVYYFGANVAGAWFGPFCFDSGELPIITLYAMYIPIFVKMFKDKSLTTMQGKIAPALAIICCVFLSFCALYSHGIVKYQAAAAQGEFSFPVLFFLIVFAVVMFIGGRFYNKKK